MAVEYKGLGIMTRQSVKEGFRRLGLVGLVLGFVIAGGVAGLLVVEEALRYARGSKSYKFESPSGDVLSADVPANVRSEAVSTVFASKLKLAKAESRGGKQSFTFAEFRSLRKRELKLAAEATILHFEERRWNRARELALAGGIAALIGVGWLLLSWSLGWLVRGFMQSETPP